MGAKGSFMSVLRSPPLTFLVGEYKSPIVVHSEIISRLSPLLACLTRGLKPEVANKCVAFDDVDPATFALLCQYAYEEDYDTPAASSEDGHDDCTALNDEKLEFEDGGEVYTAFNEWKMCPTCDYNLASHNYDAFVSELDEKLRSLSHKPSRPAPYFQLPRNKECSTSFTSVFLGHARLYVFADQWCIDSLKQLVIGKLHVTLKYFRLHPCRIKDVVELIRFIYNPEHTKEDDDLRKVLVHFVVSKHWTFMASDDFKNLLEDGGKIVTDFYAVVNDYLL